jgi:hypothetical protein
VGARKTDTPVSLDDNRLPPLPHLVPSSLYRGYKTYETPSRQTDAIRATEKSAPVLRPFLQRRPVDGTDLAVRGCRQVVFNTGSSAAVPEVLTQLALPHCAVKHVGANTITGPIPETVPEETIRVLFAPSDEAAIIIQEKPNAFCEFPSHRQAVLSYQSIHLCRAECFRR